MSERGLELWNFVIVAPDHPKGHVEFQYALLPEVSDSLRAKDPEVWSVLVDQVDDTARRKTEDSLP